MGNRIYEEFMKTMEEKNLKHVIVSNEEEARKRKDTESVVCTPTNDSMEVTIVSTRNGNYNILADWLEEDFDEFPQEIQNVREVVIRAFKSSVA